MVLQMLRHYIDHREVGQVSYLDESMVGVLIASHLGPLLPRYQEAGRAAIRLAAAKPGSAEAAEIAAQVSRMLSLDPSDDIMPVRSRQTSKSWCCCFAALGVHSPSA